MGLFRHLRIFAAVLACAIAHVPAAQVQAQTITNVAAAQWTYGAKSFSTTSNSVSIDVAALPARIDTFVPASGDGQTHGFTPSVCGGSPIDLPGDIGSDGTVSLEQTTSVHIGSVLFFRLIAPGVATDPNRIESITATLTTASGDRETVLVYETAPDSGVFLGAIPTIGMPPAAVHGDCRQSVTQGDQITIEFARSNSETVIATAEVEVLADPFGLVFDSEDATPVDGTSVTLVDAVSGAPARVFADDGVTTWPSTVITGQSVTDGAGNIHPMPTGEYRFPLAPFGQYRLVVKPPSPFSAPSTAPPAQLAGLTRPDGAPVQISDASYGKSFALSSPLPVRVDIPVDRPVESVSLTKTASRLSAMPGEAVFYTVTVHNPDRVSVKRGVTLVDTPSHWLRLRTDSVRINGAAAPGSVQVTPDGSQLTIFLGDLAPDATRIVTYAMTVRADAPPEQAVNDAVATDSRGLESKASAVVRIEQDNLAGRMTLIGRITAGGCGPDAAGDGIPDVRVVLEDGSFAITDADGRYHFEGLVPGTHVIQALSATLPEGGKFTDCSRSTRNAGSASSRFITGQGGSLAVADFVAVIPEQAEANEPVGAQPALPASDREAAGAETDWLAIGDGPTDFLFPAPDHNPRAPAVRVVIRHRAGQSVDLTINGKPVDPVAFDGTRAAPGGTYAISIWRGIPLGGEATRLAATIRDEKGAIVTQLARDVHYSTTPVQVQLAPELSHLVADGHTRPVIAVRILDRKGRPVHAGISGEFMLGAPYESAEALDAMQSRALAGLGRDTPHWTINGDDGVAYIELAPTMVSGKLHLDFTFSDGDYRRQQELDAWVVPGDQPWTLVGLAEGSVGARSIADNMERTGSFDSDLGDDARVAFYAKGRVLGRYLLTMAYDSAKQRNDQRLLGAIDPNAYYTVFADGSDRRFDAASRKKLYVRIETGTFYAIYGDFDTGFDQTELARYQRTTTGVKAELNTGGLHVQGFAAKIASTHRRDEIQGGGISGPYRLSSRAIIANSEVVAIEVRDRFRSELVVERRTLTRFIDYDIDLLAGTISFKEPILSRDDALNPQFMVIDYEIYPNATGGNTNAGLRADWTSGNERLRIGATAITDTSANGADGARTDLAGIDIKARIGENTELRAETAVSRFDGSTANAWLVEAEHHDGKLDVLAYASSTDEDFGLGQMNGAEQGRRKVGVDARLSLNDAISLNSSAWYDDSLTDATHREALQIGGQYSSEHTDARLGLSMMRDSLATGTIAKSTLLEGGVTQRVLDNRLEFSADSSIAFGKAESIDMPERLRLGARFSITQHVKLVGTYEIAKGEAIDARTARAGLEISPWNGAKIVSTLGQQDITEFGKRSFAAFGLAQSLDVTPHLTIDASVDGNRTLGHIDVSRIVNIDHPIASGGNLGEDGTIAEDFTAVTLGANWRSGLWSSTVRGEWRGGQYANRKGVTFGAIRQIGEGSMVGAGFTWTSAKGDNGAKSEVFDGAIAAAYRPAESDFAFLTKAEYRSDKIVGAIAGEAGPAGRSALTVDGDAQSRRLIGSFSGNWSPRDVEDGALVQRTEVGIFAAVRHNFDSYQGFDLSGTSLLGGIDLRLGIGERFEIGGVATARTSLSDDTTSFAVGPQIGFSPAKDVLLTVGYNISGFRDQDFSEARTTEKGVFAALRMKFDSDSFGFLGLGR